MAFTTSNWQERVIQSAVLKAKKKFETQRKRVTVKTYDNGQIAPLSGTVIEVDENQKPIFGTEIKITKNDAFPSPHFGTSWKYSYFGSSSQV